MLVFSSCFDRDFLNARSQKKKKRDRKKIERKEGRKGRMNEETKEKKVCLHVETREQAEVKT